MNAEELESVENADATGSAESTVAAPAQQTAGVTGVGAAGVTGKTVAPVRAPHSLQGKVARISGDKTITVIIERKIKHPLYKKYVRRTTKVHAHDERCECKAGDTVVIQSCRPLSKTKHWRLLEVVGQAA